MFPFEDTKLLRHPTVEKAYYEMRKFFSDGDDFAREAVRAGELMTTHCKTPDPDAIAAAVLLDGMVIRYQASSFAASVSPRAAEIVENIYDFDVDEPVFKSAAEQQIVLAHSILGLDQIYGEIKSGGVNHTIEYNNVKRALDANERSLLKIIDKTGEGDMAAVAVEKLLVTKSALDDLVRRAQADIVFEKTGLPDHPVVRGVYESMKAWDLDGHPIGGYAKTNAAIARVVVETGASSDPEVISAALLNQYSTMKEGHKKPSDFSERIGELYEESSPWASMGKGGKRQPPKTPEGKIICDAALVHFLERQVAGYKEYAKDKERFDEDSAARLLEAIEGLKDRVETAAALQDHPGLKTRMDKAVAVAGLLMNEPANTAIRKPGSPKMDPGW
ncbi:MAG: hypothetical protein EPN97_14175 [Alphaproteobacteria bacterium]|nr:MAG: hypothetical protein EPN97_14175 [Alphaproteobacteria bacterium]